MKRLNKGYYRMSHTPDYSSAPLTLKAEVEAAYEAGVYDGADVAYSGNDPESTLNYNVYKSAKAYKKAMGPEATDEIAEAAVAAYKEGFERTKESK